jgi:hypothetical protein
MRRFLINIVFHILKKLCRGSKYKLEPINPLKWKPVVYKWKTSIPYFMQIDLNSTLDREAMVQHELAEKASSFLIKYSKSKGNITREDDQATAHTIYDMTLFLLEKLDLSGDQE